MSHNTYIACASWEDRFIKGLYADYEKYTFKKIVLFYFEEERFFNLSKDNIKQAKIFFKTHNIDFNLVKLSFNNQIEIYNITHKTLSNLKSKYYLNIATMPRHLIYISLDILTAHNYDFNVLYHIPKSYDSEITKNPEIPKLLIKHSGIFEADKETLLIVSAGLDKERIFQLYYYFEPYKTIILEEKQNYSSIEKEDRRDFEKSLSEISNLDFFNIDSFKENSVFTFLEEKMHHEINQYNTLLCAIGPKIASLEIFKFNKKYPNTGIVYALSKDYSKNYSSGIDENNIFIRSSDFFN